MQGSVFRRGRLLRSAVGSALLAGTFIVGAAPAGAHVGPPSPPITITADRPDAVPAGHLWAFNDFFPRNLKVHRGDTIQVAIEGFHTATLLPKGMSPKAAWRNAGIAQTDPDDTAANPNGTPHVQIRLASLLPTSTTCGTPAAPCSFDGTQLVSSGSPTGPGEPFAVTMNVKPGTYNLVCLVHPGMAAKVTVVDRDDHASTQQKVDAQVQKQIRHDVAGGFAAERAAARNVRALPLPNGHTHWIVDVGTSSRGGHVAILEFLPGTLDIHTGDLVTWRSPSPNEPHTVTAPQDFHTDLVPLCEGAGGGPDTPASPAHLPPQGPFDFACGAAPADEIEFDGGNGVNHLTSPATVSDSGIVASRQARRAYGLPRGSVLTSWTVSFDGASTGTYHFVCQIHDGMAGTIVVH